MKLCTHSAFSKVGLSCKPSLPFSFKQDDISFEISTPVGKKKQKKKQQKDKNHFNTPGTLRPANIHRGSYGVLVGMNSTLRSTGSVMLRMGRGPPRNYYNEW